MKKLLIIALLFVGCDEPADEETIQTTDCAGVIDGAAVLDDCDVCITETNELEPNFLKDECGVCNGDGSSCIIELPTEFPLINNSGWVYEKKTYDNFTDFLLDTNGELKLDTVIILETAEDYFIYRYLSLDWYSLVKNYENRVLAIGYVENGIVNFYETINLWFDFTDTFNPNPSTNHYDGYLTHYLTRETSIDTVFNHVYNTYLFTGNGQYSAGYYDGEWQDGYFAETTKKVSRDGWIASSEIRYYDSYSDSINYYRTNVIEKLNNIELNETTSRQINKLITKLNSDGAADLLKR